MSAAAIEINGVLGPEDDLQLGVPVQLSNQDVGDEISYAWEILDKPEGSAAVLTNPAIENPLFTPDVEGTYLLRLTVDAATSTEAIDTQIAAVRFLKTNQRAPAAGELVEIGVRGWATALNRSLVHGDAAAVDNNVNVAIAGTDVGIGSIVALRGSVEEIREGFPGEEVIAVAELAHANAATDLAGKLGVVIGTPSGAAVVAGALILVRTFGLVELIGNEGGVTVGALVFITNTGDFSISIAANQFVRAVGHVVAVDGPEYRWVIDPAYNIPPRVVSALEAKVTNGSGTWSFYGAVSGQPYAGYVTTDAAATGLAYPLKVNQGERLWKITADIVQGSTASQIQARLVRGNGTTVGGVESGLATSPGVSGAQVWDIVPPSGLMLPQHLVYDQQLWLYLTSTGAGGVSRSIGGITAFVSPAT